MSTTYLAARLYDGLNDHILTQAAITVESETIIYAGSAADAPGADEQVDLGDVTLMPGLIDMHVHLTFSASMNVLEDYLSDSDEMKIMRGVENARRALMAGITTVRECGGQNAHVFALREASQRQIIAAPRIIAAGGAITTTGGHCWFFGLEADTEDELRKTVRGQVKAGADYIKVMVTGGTLTPHTNPIAPQYTEQQMQAVAEEARRLGFRVAAHCHGTPGIIYAARAGVTTIEHCSFLAIDGLIYDEAAAAAVHASGCYVCPTLAIGEGALASLPAEHPFTHAHNRTHPSRVENLKRLHALGVPFVSGSDAGVTATPTEHFAYNVTLLVDEVGLRPHEALLTATSTAAEALGRPDLGALASGKAADIIAVRGNPLDDIHALWDLELVVGRGVRYR